MIKMKKAQGLSMNYVVLGIIALLVVIVMAVIFTKYSGKFSAGIGGCTSKPGGECFSGDPNNPNCPDQNTDIYIYTNFDFK